MVVKVPTAYLTFTNVNLFSYLFYSNIKCPLWFILVTWRPSVMFYVRFQLFKTWLTNCISEYNFQVGLSHCSWQTAKLRKQHSIHIKIFSSTTISVVISKHKLPTKQASSSLCWQGSAGLSTSHSPLFKCQILSQSPIEGRCNQVSQTYINII